MKTTDIVPGLLVRQGRAVYTISNLYDDGFTARLDLDHHGQPPKRTTVHRFAWSDVGVFSEASTQTANAVRRAY